MRKYQQARSNRLPLFSLNALQGPRESYFHRIRRRRQPLFEVNRVVEPMAEQILRRGMDFLSIQVLREDV